MLPAPLVVLYNGPRLFIHVFLRPLRPHTSMTSYITPVLCLSPNSCRIRQGPWCQGQRRQQRRKGWPRHASPRAPPPWQRIPACASEWQWRLPQALYVPPVPLGRRRRQWQRQWRSPTCPECGGRDRRRVDYVSGAARAGAAAAAAAVPAASSGTPAAAHPWGAAASEYRRPG